MISLTFVSLLTVLSFHAPSTAQVAKPNPSGMDHHSSSSSCATICNSTALYKKDELNDEIQDDEKDKNKNQFPFYFSKQPSAIVALENQHQQRTKVALKYEPPPGLAAYILLSVFRA